MRSSHRIPATLRNSEGRTSRATRLGRFGRAWQTEIQKTATYKRALVHAWASLAAVRHNRNDLAKAIEACEHCCHIGEPLVEGSSPPAAECATLAGNYLQFADILRRPASRQPTRARCYRRAVELARAAYEGDQRKYGQRFRDACLAAATYAESEGQWQEAVEHWKELGQLQMGEEAGLGQHALGACPGPYWRLRRGTTALCEATGARNRRTPSAILWPHESILRSPTLADDSTDASSNLNEAIRMLQISAQHGFFKVKGTQELLDESEFDSLRDNTDFKAFLDSLPKT